MAGDMLDHRKYVTTIPFSGLFNWSVQYLNEKKISFNAAYPMVRIGDLLTRNKTAIEIEDDKLYRRATIKIRNGGIHLRDEEIGAKIGTKNQFIITEGQFLLSKIDARNGAFGVIPSELDGGIITGNFWTFDVDYNKVNPYYLSLVVTTKEFLDLCEQASNGTTNRHYLQEILFLDIKIPLPSIEEQNQLVEAYNERMHLATGQEIEASAKQSDIEAYLLKRLKIIKGITTNKTQGIHFISYRNLTKWAASEIFKSGGYSFNNIDYELKTIEQVITFFEGGKTPSTTRKDYWGDDVYWTSAKDMKELYLSNISDKISFKGIEETGLKVYPEGTLLGVFRSGILRHSFPICLTTVPTTINQDLKAIGIDETKILKHYFLLYIDALQTLVLEHSQKKGVTVESINVEEFKAVPIVCPPIEVQTEIVKHINNLKEQIKRFRTQAAENRIQALKAFEQKIFLQ